MTPGERPYVILNSAMSIDGKIATSAGRARISSDEDVARMQALRASVDGIMIGINTLLIDDPSLRLKINVGREPPARIVVDSCLRTPANAKVFSHAGRIYIGTSERADPDKVREMSERAEVIVTGKVKVDLVALMAELGRRGMRRIMLEGGGTLNWSMLVAGLVDEIRIAVAPIIIGGRDTVTLVEGEGVAAVEDAPEFELTSTERCGRDIVLTYRAKVKER